MPALNALAGAVFYPVAPPTSQPVKDDSDGSRTVAPSGDSERSAGDLARRDGSGTETQISKRETSGSGGPDAAFAANQDGNVTQSNAQTGAGAAVPGASQQSSATAPSVVERLFSLETLADVTSVFRSGAETPEASVEQRSQQFLAAVDRAQRAALPDLDRPIGLAGTGYANGTSASGESAPQTDLISGTEQPGRFDRSV